jgi:predicted nucleotidyltransferase
VSADDLLPPDWAQAIREWANRTPEVAAVFVFGSYAKRTQTAESDLDLAVIVEAISPDHEDNYTRWFFENKKWARSLSGVLPVQVDLQLGNPELSETIVGPAIRAYGILIFCRSDWKGLD